MDQYPRVEHAHVVPRMYLRNFSDADRMIGLRLVEDPAKEKVISIRDAAVRSASIAACAPTARRSMTSSGRSS